jgi:hypothetical protein
MPRMLVVIGAHDCGLEDPDGKLLYPGHGAVTFGVVDVPEGTATRVLDAVWADKTHLDTVRKLIERAAVVSGETPATA